MEEKEKKAMVEYKGEKITITAEDIKNYLCPDASAQEVGIFLKTCRSLGLNPFAKEIYLIKYSKSSPAAIVIAADTFLKVAEANPNYDGHQAGIILRNSAGKLDFREGSFTLEEEKNSLVGGWAKVYRKDRNQPFYVAVSLQECIRYTKEGERTRPWKEMPARMIRKVALANALREAFPNTFGGLYTTAEIETPEGELPEPFTKGNGEPNWAKFWAKVKGELGLSSDEAHKLLGVKSIKDDLYKKGKDLGEIFDMIAEAKRASKEVKKPEPQTRPREESIQPPLFNSEFKSKGDFFTTCYKELGLRPNEVAKELGYRSSDDLPSSPEKLQECWQALLRVRS